MTQFAPIDRRPGKQPAMLRCSGPDSRLVYAAPRAKEPAMPNGPRRHPSANALDESIPVHRRIVATGRSCSGSRKQRGAAIPRIAQRAI